MTVKEFIEILKKARDIDLAEITFYVGNKAYMLGDIGQFAISPDVNINLKEFEPPMIKPLVVRRDKAKMVSRIAKKINPNFDLQLCEECMQMTNHLNGICQKCK